MCSREKQNQRCSRSGRFGNATAVDKEAGLSGAELVLRPPTGRLRPPPCPPRPNTTLMLPLSLQAWCKVWNHCYRCYCLPSTGEVKYNWALPRALAGAEGTVVHRSLELTQVPPPDVLPNGMHDHDFE